MHHKNRLKAQKTQNFTSQVLLHCFWDRYCFEYLRKEYERFYSKVLKGSITMITRAMEDYLEVIYWLSKEKGSAKISDISQMMGVRLPSVSEMMKRLKAEELVDYEPYGEVTLTEKGMEVAVKIAARHELLAGFFMALGVEKKIAIEDACKVEHDLHPDTLKKLRNFIKFVTERSIFSKFSEYVSEEKG